MSPEPPDRIGSDASAESVSSQRHNGGIEGRGGANEGAGPSRRQRGSLPLRAIALLYVLLLLLGPIAMIFYRTFEHGLSPVWEAISEPYGVHALLLTLELVAIAVPLNTIFGVGVALLLVRKRFPGRALLGMFIDLPFAISPVVIGLSLLLVYGEKGWFGNWLIAHGIQVIFSVPGMVLACAFVSLPFVARETIPVLHELGDDAEQAASTLGAGPWYTFRRITLPAIRWGVVYGVVLTTARVLGEFGALSVVSGNIEGQTQSLTLLIENRYNNFDLTGAYTAAFLLAALALLTLVAMKLIARRTGARDSRPASAETGPAALNPNATVEVAA